MARPEATAVGGFYETPSSLVRSLSELIEFECADNISYPEITICDPCAGEGAHLPEMVQVFRSQSNKNPAFKMYTVELESARSKKVKGISFSSFLDRDRVSVGHSHLDGDAFYVEYQASDTHGANVLFLNPPYEHGKLEAKFLDRYTDALAPYGALMYLIPFYALKQSAEILATRYTNVRVLRFPKPEYNGYKQVVVIAQKLDGPFLGNPTEVIDRLVWYSEDSDRIPELSRNPKPVITVPLMKHVHAGIKNWKMTSIDAMALRRVYKAWHTGLKNPSLIGGMGTDRNLRDMIGKPMPVAMRMRPAHIAQMLAVGIFNGHVLTPDNPALGLPNILAKGSFIRDHKKVDEKTSKDGKKTTHIFVEQPRLEVTVLDIEQGTYHKLKSGTTPNEQPTIASMNIADLVHYYQRSLLALIDTQCPPLHDHRDVNQHLDLPKLPRPLFHSQEEPVYTLLKTLAKDRRGLLLGEVGVGKSSMSLCVAHALSTAHYKNTISQLKDMGFKDAKKNTKPIENVLILCPPHLVENWQDEIHEVLPDVAVHVVDSVSSLDKHVDGVMNIYLLSRETAKLGHRLEGVSTGACPVCGKHIEYSASELARKRLSCTGGTPTPGNEAARFLIDYAVFLAGVNQKLITGYETIFSKRYQRKMVFRSQQEITPEEREERYRVYAFNHESPWLSRIGIMAQRALNYAWNNRTDSNLRDAYLKVAFACVYEMMEHYGANTELIHMLVKQNHKWNDIGAVGDLFADWFDFYANNIEVFDTFQNRFKRTYRGYDKAFAAKVRECVHNPSAYFTTYHQYVNTTLWTYSVERGIERNTGRYGRKETSLFVEALTELAKQTVWSKPACGEVLYQSIPSPRRYPIATYISKKLRGMFQLLIIDEAHEYNNDGSAQERAAHRLTKTIPMVLELTGTVMNGYARSLFRSLWERSKKFREEFDRNELTAYINRYGYRKVSKEGDYEEIAVQEFGTQTDRVTTNAHIQMKVIGEAPGVMPLLVALHLLCDAATMLKEDLDEELPPCTETRIGIPTSSGQAHEMLESYKKIMTAVKNQITKDRFKPNLAGKLWGAMGQAPTYLDRCTDDVGNDEGLNARDFNLYYPKHVGSELIASGDMFDAKTILAKEQWVIDEVKRQLDRGRNVILAVWNTGKDHGLDRRWQRLITEHFGDISIILEASKVKASNRKSWIEKSVVKAGKRVMITNPVTIQTGLNNLVYFSTLIFAQQLNTANATVYRQVCGRVHRPKQPLPVEIFTPVYLQTVQVNIHDLLERKVEISKQTDGAGMQNALDSVGAGDSDEIDSMELGRLIYGLLLESEPESAEQMAIDI